MHDDPVGLSRNEQDPVTIDEPVERTVVTLNNTTSIGVGLNDSEVLRPAGWSGRFPEDLKAFRMVARYSAPFEPHPNVIPG